MLFEKVPGLYGSGIIPLKFREFKKAIHELIMHQFFSEEKLHHFIEKEDFLISKKIDLSSFAEQINYEKLYQKLVAAILESPLGGMLNMIGGESVLEPIKVQFEEKMRNSLKEMSHDPEFQKKISFSY